MKHLLSLLLISVIGIVSANTIKLTTKSDNTSYNGKSLTEIRKEPLSYNVAISDDYGNSDFDFKSNGYIGMQDSVEQGEEVYLGTDTNGDLTFTKGGLKIKDVDGLLQIGLSKDFYACEDNVLLTSKYGKLNCVPVNIIIVDDSSPSPSSSSVSSLPPCPLSWDNNGGVGPECAPIPSSSPSPSSSVPLSHTPCPLDWYTNGGIGPECAPIPSSSFSSGYQNTTIVTTKTITDFVTYCPDSTTITVTTCSSDICNPDTITVPAPTTLTVIGPCVVPITYQQPQPAVSSGESKTSEPVSESPDLSSSSPVGQSSSAVVSIVENAGEKNFIQSSISPILAAIAIGCSFLL